MSHPGSCHCRFCAAMAKRVITTEGWKAQHAPHGDYKVEPMDHPNGGLKRLMCPCGATHVTMKE